MFKGIKPVKYRGNLQEHLFTKLTDKQWCLIVSSCRPTKLSATSQTRINRILREYTHCRMFHEKIGHEVLSAPLPRDAAMPPDHPWYDHDLEQQHRRVARAAKNFRMALMHHLYPGWNGGELPLAENAAYDGLIQQVSTIEENSKNQVEYWRSAKARIKEFYGDDDSGRPVDLTLHEMAFELIATWEQNGGRVGASANDDKGGPLIRFLRETTSLVMPECPSVNVVRGWVRKYKKLLARIEEGNIAGKIKVANNAEIIFGFCHHAEQEAVRYLLS